MEEMTKVATVPLRTRLDGIDAARELLGRASERLGQCIDLLDQAEKVKLEVVAETPTRGLAQTRSEDR